VKSHPQLKLTLQFPLFFFKTFPASHKSHMLLKKKKEKKKDQSFMSLNQKGISRLGDLTNQQNTTYIIQQNPVMQ